VMLFMFLFFYVLYDYDMFHIPLSCDSLRDLWNEYICMYVYVVNIGRWST
jgi:hypothetical protein